jgi:chemotaxis protein MotB
VISLREGAFFPSGGNDIAPSSLETIGHIAATVRALPNGVRLEGHTDSIPIHNAHFRSNWELSAARAIAMMELLATRYDIPRQRFGIAGYAENLPVDTNETAEGRAHNRRVDLVILNQQLVVQTEPDLHAPAGPAPPPAK